MENTKEKSLNFDTDREEETADHINAVKEAFKALGYDQDPLEVLTQLLACTSAKGTKLEIYEKIKANIPNYKKIFRTNKRFHQTIKKTALSLAVKLETQAAQTSTDPQELKEIQKKMYQLEEILQEQRSVLESRATNTNDVEERIEIRRNINHLVAYADDLYDGIKLTNRRLQEMSIRLDDIAANINEVNETTKRIEQKMDDSMKDTQNKLAEMHKTIEDMKQNGTEHEKKIAKQLEEQLKELNKAMTKSRFQTLKNAEGIIDARIKQLCRNYLYPIIESYDNRIRKLDKKLREKH